MSFQRNQKVKFLNDNGFGIIKEVYAKSALVEKSDGFEEIFSLNELLPIDSYWVEDFVINEKDIAKEDKQATFPKKAVLNRTREVDLHFGHLVDFDKGFTSHQKFTLQLKEAKKAIEQAKKDKIATLILIHGKGTGKLEEALYEILENTENIEFFDADFKKYKLGAVEIRFK